MNKITFLSVRVCLILSVIFLKALSFAQPTQYPCVDFPGPSLTTVLESSINQFKVYSSSIPESSLLNLFNQDTNDIQPIIISGQPYSFIEIDLGSDAFINGIQFWYPNGVINFSNFYVYFTNNSLSEESQEEITNNNEYRFMHVATQYESGFYFETNHSARFITLINFTGDDIILNELKVKGKKEICGNGLDDDCDNKVDCQDDDCIVTNEDYTIGIKKQPTCPICCNGEIIIYHNSVKNIEYSIDGGITWFNNFILSNLCAGEINLKIRVNGGCNEIVRVVALPAPPGNPTSPCSNGDFENGNFQGYSGDYGVRQRGSQNINWKNIGLTLGNQLIWNNSGPPQSYPQLEIPYLGTYSAYLGVGGGNLTPEGARLDYDFTASQDLQEMCFAFALAINVYHGVFADGFFRYTIRDVLTGTTIAPITTIVGDASNTAFFTLSPSGNWVYRNWTCTCIPIPQAYWNRPLRITFEIASCYFGEHKAFVFLDGLCEPIENFNPSACFTFNACNYSSSLMVDGSCSLRENKFKWTICQTNQVGQEFNCKEVNGINETRKVNISNLFNNDFDCTKDLKIKLEVWNEDCGGYSIQEQVFALKCDNIEPAEKLILCVNTANQTQTILNPNIVCENCTYEWRDLNNSGIVFIDPTSKTPAVVVMAPHQYDVELKVTHQNGCITIKTYKVYAAYVILIYDQNEIVCDYNNCQLNLFFNMSIVGGLNVTLSNSQVIKHLTSGTLYNFDIIEDGGTSGRRYYGTAVIDINDFGGYEWIPKFGNSNSIGLESCLKPFYVPEFCYTLDDMPPVDAPRVVNPNSPDPENRLFFIQATTIDPNDPCTFYATHYLLHIQDRWGNEAYYQGLLTSCDDFIPKRIYWNLHWGDEWTYAGVHVWVLERFNCTTSKVDSGEFTVSY